MSQGPGPAVDACDMPYYDSMVLYGQAVVSPGAGGAPNTGALANPHGLPMEIYEIRFNVYPKNSSSESFADLTGQAVGVKLDLGAIAVCDSKVPVSGFSNIRDRDNAAGSIYSTPGTAVVASVRSYTWRLKYPIPIPAGAVLTPLFEHLGQNPFDLVVDIAYFCRTLPPDYKFPARVMIPWVSSFNSNSYDEVNETAAGTELSPESDIMNPFNVPLEISRLVGNETLMRGIDNDEDISDHRFRLGRIAIRGSRGDEIARAPTVFNTLFPTDWLAWDIPGAWIMRPGEFYKVNLRVGALDYNPAVANIGRVQYSITAIGYRPINTRELETAAFQPTEAP